MTQVQALNGRRSALLALGLAAAAVGACSTSSSQDPTTAGASSSAGKPDGGASSSVGGTPQQGGSRAHAGASSSAGMAGTATAPSEDGGASPVMANGGAAGNDDATAGAAGTNSEVDDYDAAILAEQPVGFWSVDRAPDQEPDLSGHGHDGTYRGAGTPAKATLPNGAAALAFDGAQQYLSVASSPAFSIPTTGDLTWEAWLRPDVLQFPHDDGSSGYVDWLGKCEEYGPTCEWEARMYSTQTNESPNRPNRLSAYVFNPGAGLGSAADWQPKAGLIVAGAWYHVVGEYTTRHQPADCDDTDSAPGSIEIWVNGVQWDHGSHGQTGCMSQYHVVPKANDSAVNIGTMAKESFFEGAIAKVAIYDHLLSEAQISRHYTLMTGKQPSGSCGNTCSF